MLCFINKEINESLKSGLKNLTIGFDLENLFNIHSRVYNHCFKRRISKLLIGNSTRFLDPFYVESPYTDYTKNLFCPNC